MATKLLICCLADMTEICRIKMIKERDDRRRLVQGYKIQKTVVDSLTRQAQPEESEQIKYLIRKSFHSTITELNYKSMEGSDSYTILSALKKSVEKHRNIPIPVLDIIDYIIESAIEESAKNAVKPLIEQISREVLLFGTKCLTELRKSRSRLKDKATTCDVTFQLEQNQALKKSKRVKRSNEDLTAKSEQTVEPIIKTEAPTRETVVTTRATIVATRETVAAKRETVVGRRETVVTTQEEEAKAPRRETEVGTLETEAPERETVAAKRETAAATRETVAPTRETVAAKRETVAATRETAAPARETVAAKRETVAAKRETAAATRETVAPTQETEAPTQETEAPTQETEAPTQETEAPTEETEAPTEETEAPTQETDVATPVIEAPTRETETSITQKHILKTISNEKPRSILKEPLCVKVNSIISEHKLSFFDFHKSIVKFGKINEFHVLEFPNFLKESCKRKRTPMPSIEQLTAAAWDDPFDEDDLKPEETAFVGNIELIKSCRKTMNRVEEVAFKLVSAAVEPITRQPTILKLAKMMDAQTEDIAAIISKEVLGLERPVWSINLTRNKKRMAFEDEAGCLIARKAINAIFQPPVFLPKVNDNVLRYKIMFLNHFK